MDFMQLQHVENAVRDAQRKKTAYVKVALNPMDTVRNGKDLAVARSTNAQENIMFNFADYVPNFLVNG